MIQQQIKLAKEYISNIKKAFVSYGRRERKFMKGFETLTHEYMIESGRIFTYEQLVECLGLPECIVMDYLQIFDKELYLTLMQQKRRKFLLNCAIGVAVALCLVGLFCVALDIFWNAPNSYSVTSLGTF